MTRSLEPLGRQEGSHDHGLGIGSGAQGVCEKNRAERFGEADGAANGACIRPASGTHVLLAGRILFPLDATLVSHSGMLAKNTQCTGNRKRKPAKGRGYHQKRFL